MTIVPTMRPFTGHARRCYVDAMNNPEILFQGQRFRVERAVQTMPDGSRHVREVVRHPGAVVILPLLDDGRVCFVRNYRVAVGQTLIELPAGTLEPDEDPAETALRELAEETGYRAGRMEHLITFCMSPGILDEQMHLYLADGIAAGADGVGGRRRHPAAAVHVGRGPGDGPTGRNPRRQDAGRTAVLPDVSMDEGSG